MGKKHIRKRQCFHFFIACLMIVIFSGCASLSVYRNKRAANDHLKKAEHLFEQGDFVRSERENRMILSIIDRGEPADKAIYNLGLIYAHRDNVERDYLKSVDLFKRILEEYPDSPIYNHAKALFFLLNDNLSFQNQNIKSQVQIENLSIINGYLLQTDELVKTNNFKKALQINQEALSIPSKEHRYDEILFNIGLIYAHHDNPDKNYKISIEYFDRLIKEYPESPLIDQTKVWQSLLDVIEKSKQVDIEIDQKKKELAR